MGTLLEKMLSSLRIKRDRYKRYEDDLKDIKKFKKEQKHPKKASNKKNEQRPPVKRRKMFLNKSKSKNKG
ncbi:hypothetical protein RCC89_15460 [Cytophagaceae bacterium ABcell3]|nr:hypothetical protein RCC89_15460 [Cytophagaceae bacterium ABcell3]